MNIQPISIEKADEIIESRIPFGLFITEDNGKYIGINNDSGDAWVEEFDKKVDCENWLMGNSNLPP